MEAATTSPEWQGTTPRSPSRPGWSSWWQKTAAGTSRASRASTPSVSEWRIPAGCAHVLSLAHADLTRVCACAVRRSAAGAFLRGDVLFLFGLRVRPSQRSNGLGRRTLVRGMACAAPYAVRPTRGLRFPAKRGRARSSTRTGGADPGLPRPLCRALAPPRGHHHHHGQPARAAHHRRRHARRPPGAPLLAQPLSPTTQANAPHPSSPLLHRAASAA